MYAIVRRRLALLSTSLMPVSRLVVVIGRKVCLSINLTEPSRYATAIYWNRYCVVAQSLGSEDNARVEYVTENCGMATDVGKLA